MLKCTELKCENLINPIGIDVPNPRFSWKLESDKENAFQKEFEIQVGEIYRKKGKGDNTLYFEYEGPPLLPKTKYTVRVRACDGDGEWSDWYEGYFITGLMGQIPRAKWLGVPVEKKAVPIFCGKFNAEDVKTAYAFASAYGMYEIYINKKRVGDSYFAPGCTSWSKRLQYQMYDISEYICSGENTIEIWLAKGWYNGRYPFLIKESPNLFSAVMCQVEINGEITAKTSAEWRQYDSPILFSEVYDGESYDSTRENVYLNEQQPVEYPIGYENLVWNCGVPVKIIEEIKPVELIKTPKGETVIDFGQNMVGWAQITADAKKGDKIKISHAEVLDKDGNFYNENYRTAKNEVTFIFNGEKEQTYHPHFSFQGFRYIRIDECDFDIKAENFVGKVICSDINISAEFESSDKLLNRLFENILWSQKGNFVDIPTDCPQRDERAGWTADIQFFCNTALKNADTAAFFTKWLLDMKADQYPDGLCPLLIPKMGSDATSSAWGDSAAVCPWKVYNFLGDKKLLESMYPVMTKWVDYIRNQGENEFLWNTGFHFGDWLGLDAKEGSYEGITDKLFIATAFYAYSVSLTLKAAKALGKCDDVNKYSELHKNIVKEFQKEFTDSTGEPKCKTQTAYALGLYMDLFKDGKAAAKSFVNLIAENGNKIQTGFVGTPYICFALSKYGYDDVVYELLLRREYPSWLYPVTKNATTIWEHWDGIKPDGSMWDADMNSFNHYAYGCIADWLYSVACGIRPAPDSTAFKKMIIKPTVTEKLEYCKCAFETQYGRVAASWKRIPDNKTVFSCEIPFITAAEIYLPNGDRIVRGSGKYTFTV